MRDQLWLELDGELFDILVGLELIENNSIVDPKAEHVQVHLPQV